MGREETPGIKRIRIKRERKLSIMKYHTKQTNHGEFAETLTCFDDSACDEKVETAAFIAPRTSIFFSLNCENYDISNYLISSTVF